MPSAESTSNMGGEGEVCATCDRNKFRSEVCCANQRYDLVWCNRNLTSTGRRNAQYRNSGMINNLLGVWPHKKAGAIGFLLIHDDN
jgi:hypothetical protein